MKFILFLTIPLYLLDQLTKAWIVKTIEVDYGYIRVTPFFNLTHIRNEGLGVFDAVREAIAVGEAADIPVVITDLRRLRDSNTVYSFFWRIFIKPFGNATASTLPTADTSPRL